MNSIKQITLENDELILILFSQLWDQDDIKSLSNVIFNRIENHHIIEHVIGADRQYIRFNFNNDYLILHFESYSNACWIEAEDQLPCASLITINDLLQLND